LLLGPQGSGKGTQAKLISSQYGRPHIATGDMLRAAIAEGTPLGRRVEPILARGDLVPDDLIVELIRERLGGDDTQAGFVLDGFPRTPAQAEALDQMLNEIGRDLDVVFELQIPDEVSIERLLNRAAVEGRPDDTLDSIRNRLRLYHDETEPLVERYRALGKLVGIPAEGTVDEVFEQIQQAIEVAGVR
jgi:adenylate kinase